MKKRWKNCAVGRVSRSRIPILGLLISAESRYKRCDVTCKQSCDLVASRKMISDSVVSSMKIVIISNKVSVEYMGTQNIDVYYW